MYKLCIEALPTIEKVTAHLSVLVEESFMYGQLSLICINLNTYEDITHSAVSVVVCCMSLHQRALPVWNIL